jgi:hypothetical protein
MYLLLKLKKENILIEFDSVSKRNLRNSEMLQICRKFICARSVLSPYWRHKSSYFYSHTIFLYISQMKYKNDASDGFLRGNQRIPRKESTKFFPMALPLKKTNFQSTSLSPVRSVRFITKCKSARVYTHLISTLLSFREP